MSRIGRQPVIIPAKVEVKIDPNTRVVHVKGPNGQLQQPIPMYITGQVKDNQVVFERESELKQAWANHGLIRSLTNNMVLGVSKGFKKELELVGIGYKAEVKANKLEMGLGFSHPVIMDIPKDIKVEVVKSKKEKKLIHIYISGPDKMRVGQYAANIKKLRRVEPYKGKGLRYAGQYVIRKAGKKKT